MPIPEETIQRVRDASDIVEVIAESVPNMKRAGKDFKALCPFHQEKTPSFTVSPSKGIFHCFGCGVGGDVFKFVMAVDRCSYPEAIEKLAEKRGIPVPRTAGGGSENAASRDKRRRLLDLLERAAQFYQRNLDASPARDYLHKARKLSPETVEKFRLGWARPELDALLRTALKAGFTEAELIRAGLAVRSQRDGRVLDWFRGRVMFPIFDTKGSVTGFGGRVLEDKGANAPPKYINSSENEVFQKGKLLYGLYQGARAVRDSGEVLLVEGYMDVIACHQAGVETAAAPLGTSLTQEQCQVLKRYAERVTLLFDMDAAGRAAAMRGAELLLDFGFLPMVASLPGAKDADEFLKKHAEKELSQALARRKTVVESFLESHLAKNEGLPPEVGKVYAARAVMPVLHRIKDEVARSEMLKLVADRLRVSPEALLSEWNKSSARARHSGPPRLRDGPSGSDPLKKRPPAMKTLLSSAEELLCLAILHPGVRTRALELAGAAGLAASSPLWAECRTLFIEAPPGAGAADILSLTGNELSGALSGLLLRFQKVGAVEPEQLFEALKTQIERRRREDELRHLGRSVGRRLNQGSGTDEDVLEYQRLAPIVKGSRKI